MAEGARPGLDAPLAQDFLAAVGGAAAPKYGWTDVARFSALGIPAVNYGPGDPLKAHADDERVAVSEILECERGLRAWLTRPLTLKARYRLTPWWVKVIVIFAASRVVTTAIMLWFAARQETNAWTGARPDYFDFAAIWDGHWYYIVSVVGYPTDLPMTADGHVAENAWAFMPAYPAGRQTVHGAHRPGVSRRRRVRFRGVRAGGRPHVLQAHEARGARAARRMFAVVLFCVAPLSPILQVTYAESMHLLLLTLALYLLMKRRYWMLIPVIAVMSLTRPSGLAFALTMLLHVAYRWWMQRPGARNRQAFPRRERVASIVAGLFSAIAGFAWLLIAWGRHRVADRIHRYRAGVARGLHRLRRARAVHGVGERRSFLGALVRDAAADAARPARDHRRRVLHRAPVAVVTPHWRRPAAVDRQLRALPARGVLSPVEHFSATRAALPGARPARTSEVEDVPGTAGCPVHRGPGGVGRHRLVGRWRRLDAAVTVSVVPSFSR